MKQGSNPQMNQQNSHLFKYSSGTKPSSASGGNSNKLGDKRSHTDMNGSISGHAGTGKSHEGHGGKMAKTSDQHHGDGRKQQAQKQVKQ